MRLLVCLILASLALPVATASAKKPIDPRVDSGVVFTTVSKPVEVTPAEVAAAAATSPDGQNKTSVMTASPSCTVDEYGNCISDTSESWEEEADWADGTLGYYDYSAKHCFFATAEASWGTWPYQQTLSNDTYWCSMYYQYVSYRFTHIRLGSSLCTKSGAFSYRIGGGIGQSLVWVRAGGSFSCGIPYIGGYNRDHLLDSVWQANGNVYISGTS
jgi:hypothetical protein